MNLICFPHYTCGGLLCDILNNTFSEIRDNGAIESIEHRLGKIGDTETVLVDYDTTMFQRHLEQLSVAKKDWIGTHCWPGQLDLSTVDQVIVVSTATSRSRLYRWARSYFHYYVKSDPWVAVSGQCRIDKERETAKNYLIPFAPVSQSNVINIEFAEIVECSVEFKKLIGNNHIDRHLERWKQINYFLYDPNFWHSTPVKRFYEAELETGLNTHYVYE